MAVRGAARPFIGTWEVIGYGYINGSHGENTGLEGVRFRLDENGDVFWTVSEELKTVPLFNCETYEIYWTTVLNAAIRFGAYGGHVIDFVCEKLDPGDNMVITCDAWCMLQCKRIQEEPQEFQFNSSFSLLPALEGGFFGDIKISAANNKQFVVHSDIVQLIGSDIPWKTQPPPFTGLPEDVLGTILHYLYAECLPDTLTEATAKQVIVIGAQYQSLNHLVSRCQLYLKNMALKQQIIGLVNDMHSCANKVIDHFTIGSSHTSTDTIRSNPAKLCFVVKQSVRDAAVVGAKLLLLCDLFSKRKNELSREERHEIIRYAKSRLPIFMTQLHKLLQVVKNTFGSMCALERNEIATYLVPEIEVILDTVSTLVVKVQNVLHQIIQVLSPHEEVRRKSSVGEMFGRSLKNVLHIKELAKLKKAHEAITCTLGLLVHKRENFQEMTPTQKVRSVARNFEQLIEELPIFLLRLEEVTGALDEKLEWREFKFCFKVGTSKASGVLQKLVPHQSTLQEVLIQLCELVQRDAFTQSLCSLGLLHDTSKVTMHSEDYQRSSTTASSSSPKQQGHNFNLVESLCVSPSPSNSTLAKLCLQLLESGLGTDMEFEIIVSNNVSEQTLGDHTQESSSPADYETSIVEAHRVIVAARCDWFRRALSSGMREAIEKKITVHDSNPVIFRIFMEFLYGGQIPSNLTTDQFTELLLLSDRYEVDTLKHVCECVLRSNIDEESVLYFLSLADQTDARILRKACLRYISQHNEITESELFHELPLALQAEIFNCIWTQSPPIQSTSVRSGSLSPDSELGDMHKMNLVGDQAIEGETNSNLGDELTSSTLDRARLSYCLAQLQEILGDSVSTDILVQIALAADNDVSRALNYLYSREDQPQ